MNQEDLIAKKLALQSKLTRLKFELESKNDLLLLNNN